MTPPGVQLTRPPTCTARPDRAGPPSLDRAARWLARLVRVVAGARA
jgi:hypothetical protein